MTDGLGTLDRAWHGYGAARLCRGRVVGARCRGRPAGSAPRRRRGPARRRPVCGAWRQGGAACGRRRTRHRGRSLAGAPCPVGRELKRLVAHRRACLRRRGRMGRGTVRCGAARRPLLLDRHDPAPSRRAVAQAAGRCRKLTGLQRRLIERAVALTEPGGMLVYCTCSLEPDEGEAIVNGLLAHETSVRRVPVNADEVYGRAEFVTKEATCAPCPATCQIPIRGVLASTAFMPQGSSNGDIYPEKAARWLWPHPSGMVRVAGRGLTALAGGGRARRWRASQS